MVEKKKEVKEVKEEAKKEDKKGIQFGLASVGETKFSEKINSAKFAGGKDK